MTEFQTKYGPFAGAPPSHWPGLAYVVVGGVADRIAVVKASTDAEWLEAVVHDAAQPKTVLQAAARRLKWVNQAVAALHKKAQS